MTILRDGEPMPTWAWVWTDFQDGGPRPTLESLNFRRVDIVAWGMMDWGSLEVFPTFAVELGDSDHIAFPLPDGTLLRHGDSKDRNIEALQRVVLMEAQEDWDEINEDEP